MQRSIRISFSDAQAIGAALLNYCAHCSVVADRERELLAGLDQPGHWEDIEERLSRYEADAAEAQRCR